jgi:hypothetical protein
MASKLFSIYPKNRGLIKVSSTKNQPIKSTGAVLLIEVQHDCAT